MNNERWVRKDNHGRVVARTTVAQQPAIVYNERIESLKRHGYERAESSPGYDTRPAWLKISGQPNAYERNAPRTDRKFF